MNIENCKIEIEVLAKELKFAEVKLQHWENAAFYREIQHDISKKKTLHEIKYFLGIHKDILIKEYTLELFDKIVNKYDRDNKLRKILKDELY